MLYTMVKKNEICEVSVDEKNINTFFKKIVEENNLNGNNLDTFKKELFKKVFGLDDIVMNKKYAVGRIRDGFDGVYMYFKNDVNDFGKKIFEIRIPYISSWELEPSLFKNGYARVKNSYFYEYHIKLDGTPLYDRTYLRVGNFKKYKSPYDTIPWKLAKVIDHDGFKKFINISGEIVSPVWGEPVSYYPKTYFKTNDFKAYAIVPKHSPYTNEFHYEYNGEFGEFYILGDHVYKNKNHDELEETGYLRKCIDAVYLKLTCGLDIVTMNPFSEDAIEKYPELNRIYLCSFSIGDSKKSVVYYNLVYINDKRETHSVYMNESNRKILPYLSNVVRIDDGSLFEKLEEITPIVNSGILEGYKSRCLNSYTVDDNIMMIGGIAMRNQIYNSIYLDSVLMLNKSGNDLNLFNNKDYKYDVNRGSNYMMVYSRNISNDDSFVVNIFERGEL